MTTLTLEAHRGRLRIEALVQVLGDDLLVSLWGGTRPHIGAVGMAVPRPSHRDPAAWSATSSVHTFLGHKEDVVVKEVAEALAGGLRRNVVVAAGLHWDDLTAAEIGDVVSLTRALADDAISRVRALPSDGAKE